MRRQRCVGFAAKWPPRKNTHLIAITAKPQSEAVGRLRQAGISQVLAKPVRRGALAEAITRCRPGLARQCLEGWSGAQSAEIIDRHQLRALADDYGRADLWLLLDEFTASMAEKITLLDEAATRDDPARVEHIAHAIVGCAAAVGAQRLAGLSRIVETTSRNGNRLPPAAWRTWRTTLAETHAAYGRPWPKTFQDMEATPGIEPG